MSSYAKHAKKKKKHSLNKRKATDCRIASSSNIADIHQGLHDKFEIQPDFMDSPESGPWSYYHQYPSKLLSS